jgi:hypothetical protein
VHIRITVLQVVCLHVFVCLPACLPACLSVSVRVHECASTSFVRFVYLSILLPLPFFTPGLSFQRHYPDKFASRPSRFEIHVLLTTLLYNNLRITSNPYNSRRRKRDRRPIHSLSSSQISFIASFSSTVSTRFIDTTLWIHLFILSSRWAYPTAVQILRVDVRECLALLSRMVT